MHEEQKNALCCVHNVYRESSSILNIYTNLESRIFLKYHHSLHSGAQIQ